MAMKDGSIDAGLHLLKHYRHPRGYMTQREIAYVCGCSPTRIQQIELKALQKCFALITKMDFDS